MEYIFIYLFLNYFSFPLLETGGKREQNKIMYTTLLYIIGTKRRNQLPLETELKVKREKSKSKSKSSKRSKRSNVRSTVVPYIHN